MFLGWILVALCATFALAADEIVEDHVFQANSENFEQLVKGSEKVMVKFMAEWCTHCKHLKAPYVEAARRLLEHPNIKLAEIDATEHSELAEKHKVQGFPTLLVFTDGGETVVSYEGGRTTDDIVEYLLRKPLQVNQNRKDIEKILGDAADKNKEFVFVAFLDEGDERWVKRIQDLRDSTKAPVAIAANKLATDFHVKADHLAVFRPRMGIEKNIKQLPLNGGTAASDIKTFFFIRNKNPIEKFDMERVRELIEAPPPIEYVTFLFDESASSLEQYEDVAKKLEESTSHMTIVPSEMEKEMLETIYTAFNIGEKDFPAYVMMRNREKYKRTGKLTPEQLLKWEQGVVAGKIKPSLNSEEPTDNDLKGNVWEIRGKTFEQLVIQNARNVLVYVYAPFSQNLEELEPIYSKIGDTYADDDTTVIAQMDGSKNEVEGLEITELPMLTYYPVGKKADPIQYPDKAFAMTHDNVVQWLKDPYKVADEL